MLSLRHFVSRTILFFVLVSAQASAATDLRDTRKLSLQAGMFTAPYASQYGLGFNFQFKPAIRFGFLYGMTRYQDNSTSVDLKVMAAELKWMLPLGKIRPFLSTGMSSAQGKNEVALGTGELKIVEMGTYPTVGVGIDWLLFKRMLFGAEAKTRLTGKQNILPGFYLAYIF